MQSLAPAGSADSGAFAFCLATCRTHTFEQWMTLLQEYIRVDVIQQSFDALDSLFRSGYTVHYARCWVLQFDWGKPALP